MSFLKNSQIPSHLWLISTPNLSFRVPKSFLASICGLFSWWQSHVTNPIFSERLQVFSVRFRKHWVFTLTVWPATNVLSENFWVRTSDLLLLSWPRRNFDSWALLQRKLSRWRATRSSVTCRKNWSFVLLTLCQAFILNYSELTLITIFLVLYFEINLLRLGPGH